ncbi:hypothetical protein ACFQ2B_28020 [Streptomyces stramineus]
MSLWAALVALTGTLGMIVAGVFAARATKAAASATAEATRAAAQAAAEPEQRRVDLEAFKTIRDDLKVEVGSCAWRQPVCEPSSERSPTWGN